MKNCLVEDQSELNKLNELSEYLRVIADINRLKILRLLRHGERCVCNINEPLGLPQNLVSHHLKTLRDASLVIVRREGKWAHYRINTERLNYFNEIYNEIISPERPSALV